jgi:hypothetical protein
MKKSIMDLSLRNAAMTAGIGLLIMAVIAPIANFAILQKLVLPEDIAGTANNLMASEGLFRLGICCFLVVAVLDILVAWALYVFLKPVNRSLSMLAAWFRLVYATILVVVLIHLINVLQLLNGTDYISAFTVDQIHAQIMLSLNRFTLGWESGLIIFGIHLLLLGYLVFRAGYMRKVLGILIILAASGYMIDGFGKIISPDYDLPVSMFTFIGEVILIFWLLIKGRKIEE